MKRDVDPLPGRFLAVLLMLGTYLAGCASSTPARQSTAGTAARDSAAAVVTPREIPQTVPVQSRRQTAAVDPADTVRAGRFDAGKMWAFEYAPVAYFRETYGFEPDEAWFERARLGALRIPGCTASFVSPNGLMLTNHHCSRGHLPAVTREGEDLLDDGFYASSLGEERRAASMYAEQLIAIEDVTDEVYAALEGRETDAERAAARQEAIDRITERVRQAAGGDVTVQVVALFNGGRYSAYTFRRFDDVRLVLIPENALGYFGGDPDNFTYPRYTLDMTFWRVYGGDGQPLKTPEYFRWSLAGSKEGDAVFVVGNPGSTSRLETVAQLEYRRDLGDRVLLDMINARVAALQEYVDRYPDDVARQNALFGLLNAQKVYAGRMEALRDPVLIARRRDAERQFLEAVHRDAALQATYGDVVDRMAALQAQRAEMAADLEVFLGLTPTSSLGAPVLRRAMQAYPYLTRRAAGEDDAALASVRQALLGVGDQPHDLQVAYLTTRFEMFERLFGADSPIVRQILDGRTPEAAARAVVEGSALAEASTTKEAVEAGTLTMDDPAVRVAAALWDRYQAFVSANNGLTAREQEVASQIGRAKFEVYGTDLPPDATFSLRIADGVVAGYPYNGTVAPAYTTMYGLYDHYYSYGPDSPWGLPERWVDRPEGLDLSTPMNLVSTNDIIGGNSGSPLLNRDLELVGLVFDGNIESLVGAYIYLTDRVRTVSVDARAIIESLDDVYEADRIVQELKTGRLVATEADADEQMQGGR